MNKVIFALGIAFACSMFTHSVNAQLRKIPAEVTDHFNQKYPGATSVEWKDRLTGFSAAFVWDGLGYIGNFGNKGDWESTEHEIENDDLPEAVDDGFQKSRYADWDINRIVYIELPDDEVNYRIEVGKGDIKKRNLYFSEKGRLLRDKLTL